MGHDSGKPKCSINVTLDVDLVRRASLLTTDIGETMGALLSSYVETEEARRANDATQIAQWIAASNAMVARFGAPGDEYSPF